MTRSSNDRHTARQKAYLKHLGKTMKKNRLRRIKHEGVRLRESLYVLRYGWHDPDKAPPPKEEPYTGHRKGNF
jgi:hypothetical protein